MLDVARSMARLPFASDRWADAPAQLVSSRLEQGARSGSTPSSSIDSTTSSSRWPESSLRTLHNPSSTSHRPGPGLERAESFMSTASASSSISTAATIAKASTATIRKLQRSDDASAKTIRFAKHRKDPDSITPSSSAERMSSLSTDGAEDRSSPIFAGDQSQSTVTTSFDTTVRTPSDYQPHRTADKSDHEPALRNGITLNLVEPSSFFSDSLSGDDSSRSISAAASSRLTPLHTEASGSISASRRGSDQANSDLGASMSRSSSYQSAMSSLAPSADSQAHSSRSQRLHGPPSAGSYKPGPAAKFGLGIQTRGSSQPADVSISASRYLAGPSLEVVPEARESPYMGSRASQAASTPDMNNPSGLSVSTALPPNREPIWGESASAISPGSGGRSAGVMTSFSFPSNGPSSAGLADMSRKSSQPGPLSARFPRSPGSAFHSSNPSVQSSYPYSSRASDAGLLHASNWSHAPPSSYAGSIISSSGATSMLGYSSLNPTDREGMLHQLLLDQARVDCQEYGTLSLEEVAEAKRDLKHVERKVQSLRTKLKVEIKIRDAAVALRKAHRTTAASAHSPTSSINLAVSPTLPTFANSHTSGVTLPSSAPSSTSSYAARSRAFSISTGEAKADEDVHVATAKVDKVANELFKWNERANTLRRKLLEHQAATLSERVQHLESDRRVTEESLPTLPASASFESLAPSASASAVGINRYRGPGHRCQPSTDELYHPRGADDPVRHNRLESDMSAISGFSFPDAAAPDKSRRLAEELERKRETLSKLEADLESAREAARRKDETSDRLTQQLEEQSRERNRTLEELRTMTEQAARQEEAARQRQAQAIRDAVADVEQKMQRQLEQSRSRDHEREDALVNSKAEVMAGQRAMADLQLRLDAAQNELKATQLRAEAAEKASQDHRRTLEQMQGESTRQLTRGTEDLTSIQAQLTTIKSAHDRASALAADRAQAIAQLEKDLKQAQDAFGDEKARLIADHAAAIGARQAELEQARSDLSSKAQRCVDLDKQVATAQERIVESQARAEQADGKLRELELAVGAERRIMAERDELFHAFERRLETAEKRLQEQDKRCARMLGKLEGREEMDDLLERIKAGAAGVAKKKKTAGQDIAALLSSLETHIGDLELELVRANEQISASPRGSVAASDSPASKQQQEQLQASNQEAQRWKEEAQHLKDALQAEKSRAVDAPPQDHKQVQELAAKVDALTEQNEAVRAEGEQRAVQLEKEVQDLVKKNEDLDQQGKELVAQLQGKLERMEGRCGDLEKQLRSAPSPASPANSIDALPLRASKAASPLSARFAPNNKGVGNLIDKFGGGRRVASESRADDSPTMMHACIRSAENLRAMLPDLSAAAKGSADLHALRDAFEAADSLPTSPTAAKSPTSVRSMLGSADLQAELDATAERLRSTLAISRAVIDMALEAEADKENRGPSVRKEESVAAKDTQAEALASQQALVTRITSLTAKVKEQADREKRLKAEVTELREQLEEANAAERALPSPSGLTLEGGSMLGLSTSPARLPDINSLGLSRSLGRTSSNQSMRTVMGDKASPKTFNTYLPVGATLAPPRSPAAMDAMPSPTRSNTSLNASPSIRYISPFAPPSFDNRTHQRQAVESRSMGPENSTTNNSFSDISKGVGTSDSVSLRSVSSPSSTHLGLPSSAASLADTSLSSVSNEHRLPDSNHSNKLVKRTITLGMDVPQLVSRVRELERQLSQTASIRQRAERVSELEIELRKANLAYSKLLDRMDAERDVGTHQKVEMLNELNDAQAKLQTTQAQMLQRAQAQSPFLSPLVSTKPLPPPKD
ncbi:Uds1 domain-containing protein [Pseudozyma hubeiensis]|nr:Uds1 domain-containing protein [Pseudozyma hubeiensis]